MDKKTLASITLFFLIVCAAPATDALKLRVITEQASVHLKPDLNSTTLMIIPKGALLDSTHRVDEWYVVILPPDDRGFKPQGYISLEVVEVVEGKEDIQAALPQDSPPPEPYIAKPEKLFSGFVIKLGWMRSPDSGGFDKSWITGLNFDIGLNRNLALGIELMPSFRSFSDPDIQIIPIMGFVNLKAGFSMGDLVRPLGFMSPYAGIGAGLDATYTIVDFEGETHTNFSTQTVYHVFVGLQLNLGALKLIGEYQWARVSDPNVDPNFWRHYLLFGFRFGR